MNSTGAASTFARVLPIGGWILIASGAVLGAGAALVVSLARQTARRSVLVAAGAIVGALLVICWSEVVGVGPLWSAARGTQPPPWLTGSTWWPVIGAVVAGGFVAFVLSEPAGAEPARASRQEASRAVITITIVCTTGYLGSAALGSATAVVTTSPKPPNLEIWSTVGAEEVELQIVVGEAGDWDADPAFPTGPVEVEITVRGTPGQLAYVVLVGDQHLETSKWVADTATVSEVDPRDFVHATRDGTRCVEGVITGTGWFTSARALKVGVRISEDGSGRAHVKYTDERRWWRASGGRSEVSLPVVSFADQSSCVIPPEAGADAWFVPAHWTLVERAGQPNLGAGDLVVVYRVDDGQSELFKEKSAARWTLRSGSEGESGSLAPTYRLETVNTRSHATTSAFVAALMYGVALTGLFELVRAAGPGWRVPTGTLARSSVPPAVASTNRSTGAGSVSAVAPTRRERRRRVAGVLTLLALAALAKRPRSR